jgi:putative pyoverdin transport system ATP-binding/permease protein
MAIAAVTGAISGACSAASIALINTAITDPNRERLLLGFVGLAIAALVTSVVSQYLLSKLSYEAIFRMRLRLSCELLACPLRHLEELGANRILATLTEDTEAIAGTVAIVPFLCIDLAVIVGCLGYLAWLSWQVFLVTFAFLLVAVFCVQFLIAKAHQFLERSREEQDKLFQHFRTLTDGIKELKLNARRRHAFLAEELEVAAASSRNADITSMGIFGITFGIGRLVFFGAIGLLLFAMPQLHLIETPVLAAYILVITYLLEPLQRILEMTPGLSRGSVALDKLRMLGMSLASHSEASAGIIVPSAAFERIELINVTYVYRNHREESFKLGPIDFAFSSGELIFIIGGNGSGKSTLVKAIAGLYVPSGEIRLDGQPISERNRENYRQLFSSVFGDFYLFERLLGLQSPELEEKVWEYLKLLQLDSKVQLQGDRFSTIELSQGQRKRLALLTAYLEDRPIYIFDEWAADQDPLFREIFYKQLLPELKNRGKTVLVITHDDRYFHLGDRLLKLDYGKLVALDPIVTASSEDSDLS